MSRSSNSGFQFEDPLTYLPRKSVIEFSKGSVIFNIEHPPENLFLVILGRVKLTTIGEDGVQTVSRIVCSEGLFGEAALIGHREGAETAIALDNATLMSWTRAEIEQQIEREPRLGIALAQYLSLIHI